MAFEADGPQYQYRFTLDDQQRAIICWTTMRHCQASRSGCEGVIGGIKV